MKNQKNYLKFGLLISIVSFIIIMMSSCTKNQNQGYRINNLSGYDLNIYTSGQVITLKTTESIYFVSEKEPEFKTDEPIKLRHYSLGTNPVKTYNIVSYKHDFEVKISNRTYFEDDSVEVFINNQRFKEKLPFYYGTDKQMNSYSVLSTPINEKGIVFTLVYKDGKSIDMAEGKCNLKGDL